MFTLIVVLCLVGEPKVCGAPVEVVPSSGAIASMGHCMKGGPSYFTQQAVEGEKMGLGPGTGWFAKTYCSQKLMTDYQVWIARKKLQQQALFRQWDGVHRSPWNTEAPPTPTQADGVPYSPWD